MSLCSVYLGRLIDHHWESRLLMYMPGPRPVLHGKVVWVVVVVFRDIKAHDGLDVCKNCGGRVREFPDRGSKLCSTLILWT